MKPEPTGQEISTSEWGPWEHDRWNPDGYVRHKKAPDGSDMADYLGLGYLNGLEHDYGQALAWLLERAEQAEARAQAAEAKAALLEEIVQSGALPPSSDIYDRYDAAE